MSGETLAVTSPILERLFPSFVAVRRCDPGTAPIDALFPDERTQLSNALTRRLEEFAAGRVAARAALAALGAPAAPLLTGTDRVPLWPPGFVGSISHARAYGVAVVARSTDARGVGVDVEAARRVEERLWGHLFDADEIAAIGSHPEPERASIAAIAFSAKEALFKCQYAVRRGWLGFHDVSVRVEAEIGRCGAPGSEGRVTLVFRRDAMAEGERAAAFPRGTRLDGRFAVDGAHVLTGVTLGID